MMAMRLLRPSWLVDINEIAALKLVALEPGLARTGACTRQCVIERDDALAEKVPLLKQALADRSSRGWSAFVKRYRQEMRAPEKVRLLSLLAALSHQTSFSVGCYCEDEAHCHRSVLRELLRDQGATIV